MLVRLAVAFVLTALLFRVRQAVVVHPDGHGDRKEANMRHSLDRVRSFCSAMLEMLSAIAASYMAGALPTRADIIYRHPERCSS